MQTHSRPHLYVSDRGAGEPLLLITGWTISSAIFDPVADLYLSHLRVIAYDHRGAGRSARWDAPVSMGMLAADAARVLDNRGERSAHVLGLSMGAAVAIEFAARMPDRVRSLVLVGGGGGGPTTSPPPVAAVVRSLARTLTESARCGGIRPAAMLFSDAYRERHPERLEEYLAHLARHRAEPWVAAWQALAVACYGRRRSLPRIGAPALVIHGGEDVMVGVRNARVLADRLPDAELQVMPGAGHAVLLEQPRATAALVTDWVRRHAGSEPPASSWAQATAERISRPFSLASGTARNVADLPQLAAERALAVLG